ncbi:MAG: DNA polymerase I [Bacteroidales bacterium]|nr:DNA polymerase I [Bacteroidales bacterium]MCF8343972.1 DNA polymerase I [Bacteroidales bacterium]MCF8350897.1 DNA polymerase I [Bacteroidales bacterium]MCF8376919.1 DNA polymerase I [Bacteroidales bacterium]MCF8400812.1 DNA polymerase I [Bacteroidales bacterium]
MPANKRLYLLDAMALVYRAYFALNRNPRINSKGLNTSAILGFANSLYDILKNEKPTHIGVAIDTIAPTVRHQEFEEYKATREDMPEDISTSLPYIRELIKAFNIPLLYVDGYEADDIIGTLAKKAEEEGFETFMVTPDKDFGQLVSENIYMYKPAIGGKKAEVLGVAEICNKYGIKEPKQLIDILGLWGDTSDNIPGVPGIGEKTSSKLIHEFESIENILKNTGKLKGKQKENLENFAEQALLSRDLATIILDAPIEFNSEELKVQEPDQEALTSLFRELEFRAFAKRVFADISISDEEKAKATQTDLFGGSPTEDLQVMPGKNTFDPEKVKYQLVDDEQKQNELIREIREKGSFCFDTETTGIDPNQSELIGISFAMQKGGAFFLMLPENYQETLDLLKKFKAVFEDEDIEKTGQNLKYDISMLKWYEIEVKGKLFDTMIAHYLLEPDLRHSMDYLAETYLNYKPISIETLIGKKGKNQKHMRTVSVDKLKDYSCEDADITLQLREAFEPQLKEAGAENLFYDIEIPLMMVLATMEAEGVKIDIGALKKFSRELEMEIRQVEEEIHNMAGISFNVASTRQLGEVLFKKLKITDKPKLTKTKQFSTSEDVLQKMVNKHPIVSKVLDYRSLTKLKSTYVDTLPLLVNPRDGRVHTSYMQTVAATGRLSSQNPNLQNIPIRTKKGREIRKAFVPRNENYTLLAADYSQIELRIIADLSGDKGMLEAFQKGQDIHASTAAKVYGVPLEEVNKEMRRNAKTVNFGIMYGISAFGLSERLNIPRGEAKEIIDAYFEQFTGIREYMDKTIAFAKDHGYVETIMGRRRYLRDINSSNSVVRGFAERNAINAPIQGSSADMIKIAMISIFNEFNKNGYNSRMILQVHDELVFDAYKEELEIIKPLIIDKMKNAIRLKVPVEVDINTGSNWLEAH